MSSHFNTPQIVPPSSLENTNESTTETESITDSTTESTTDFVNKLVNVTGNELANLIFLKYFASKFPDTNTNMVGASGPTWYAPWSPEQQLIAEFSTLNNKYRTKFFAYNSLKNSNHYTDYIKGEIDDLLEKANYRFLKADSIYKLIKNQYWEIIKNTCHYEMNNISSKRNALIRERDALRQQVKKYEEKKEDSTDDEEQKDGNDYEEQKDGTDDEE
jgi:hypothetical protein